MSEENLKRYRRQRAMQHLYSSYCEAVNAWRRAQSREDDPFGPAMTLAYQLEHSRASLSLLKEASSLPGSAEQWLDTYGDDVRLFRNRVDHYDEDMVEGVSLEEQFEKSAGVSISHSGGRMELRIRGKGREFNLEVTDILRELEAVYHELVSLDHHRWRGEL